LRNIDYFFRKRVQLDTALNTDDIVGADSEFTVQSMLNSSAYSQLKTHKGENVGDVLRNKYSILSSVLIRDRKQHHLVQDKIHPMIHATNHGKLFFFLNFFSFISKIFGKFAGKNSTPPPQGLQGLQACKTQPRKAFKSHPCKAPDARYKAQSV
jgi:hypothetical protein